MGKIVFAVYKPFEGKTSELLALIEKHTPILFAQNLITDRKAIVLKSENGEIIEIFEWLSDEAINNAHENEEVIKIWNAFGKICSYETLGSLEESKEIFPSFEVQ